MKIVTLFASNQRLIDWLATLSIRASQTHAPNWLKTAEDGYEILEEALQPEKACRVLLGGSSNPLGWVAAGPLFGRVWELHPLLIDPEHQRRGYGRLLAVDIERLATDAGALTMQLSTSDTTHATTLSGIDLYGDPIGELSRIGVLDEAAGHAFQFWRKVGYTLVGVLPDAEGSGMPSVSFAKRLLQ